MEREQISKVWLLVEKKTGWVAREANYKEDLDSQRGFEKLEVIKTEHQVLEYSRYSRTECWYTTSSTYDIEDGRVAISLEGGLYIVDQETAKWA